MRSRSVQMPWHWPTMLRSVHRLRWSGPLGLLTAAVLTGSIPLDAQVRTFTVRLPTSDGATVVGTLLEPAHQPAPAVVMIHMLTRSRRDWDQLATRLADRGFVTLALDLRGHGESAASAPMPSDGLQAMRQDVQAAHRFLQGRAGVMADRIGMIGASIGANLAVLESANQASVRSLVLLSPGLDYRGLRTEAALRTYGDRPALLIASSEDSYALRSVRRLEQAGGGRREVRIVESAGHGTMMLLRRPELADLIVDWFRGTLGG